MTSPLLRLLDASHAASSRTCQLLVKRKLLENELLMEGKEVPNYPTNAAVKEYEDAMPAAKKNIRNLHNSSLAPYMFLKLKRFVFTSQDASPYMHPLSCFLVELRIDQLYLEKSLDIFKITKY